MVLRIRGTSSSRLLRMTFGTILGKERASIVGRVSLVTPVFNESSNVTIVGHDMLDFNRTSRLNPAGNSRDGEFGRVVEVSSTSIRGN